MLKYKLKLPRQGEDNLNVPINIDFDFLGRDMAIDEYETQMVKEVIGEADDFEVSRFVHASHGNQKTNISYDFYFYTGNNNTISATTNADQNLWVTNYLGPYTTDFKVRELYYYQNTFANSFFKLDFYDSDDDSSQTNYLTIILPVQQGKFINTTFNGNNVKVRRPSFSLDYVGDKEGFFIYWLKKRTFLDINTFYVSAKFFDAKNGQFIRMLNQPQCNISGNKFKFNQRLYFYYRYELDYATQTYQVFNTNTNNRVGTTTPINWYEYINP